MKKVILLFALSISLSLCDAQAIKFSILGGINESTFVIRPNGESLAVGAHVGYHVGALLELGGGGFSLQSGLLYTTKGGTSTATYPFYPLVVNGINDGSSRATQNIRLNYLQTPINILYHIPIAIGKVFVGTGPYLGYGLSSTWKSSFHVKTNTGQDESGSKSGSLPFGNQPNDYKNPDLGINVTAGIDLKQKVFFGLSYAYGFTNLSGLSNYYTSKNRCLSLSLGFRLQ